MYDTDNFARLESPDLIRNFTDEEKLQRSQPQTRRTANRSGLMLMEELKMIEER